MHRNSFFSYPLITNEVHFWIEMDKAWKIPAPGIHVEKRFFAVVISVISYVESSANQEVIFPTKHKLSSPKFLQSNNSLCYYRECLSCISCDLEKSIYVYINLQQLHLDGYLNVCPWFSRGLRNKVTRDKIRVQELGTFLT